MYECTWYWWQVGARSSHCEDARRRYGQSAVLLFATCISLPGLHRRGQEFVLGALLRPIPPLLSFFPSLVLPHFFLPRNPARGSGEPILGILGSQNAFYGNVSSHLCAMQMTVKYLLEMGDTVNPIQLCFWWSANPGFFGAPSAPPHRLCLFAVGVVYASEQFFQYRDCSPSTCKLMYVCVFLLLSGDKGSSVWVIA